MTKKDTRIYVAVKVSDQGLVIMIGAHEDLNTKLDDRSFLWQLETDGASS